MRKMSEAKVAAIEEAMEAVRGRYVLGVPQGRRPMGQVQIYPAEILALCAAWRREQGRTR